MRRFPQMAESLEVVLRRSTGPRSMREIRELLAENLNVEVETVDSWRRGVRCIPKDKIERVVRVLGHTLLDGSLTSTGLHFVELLQEARASDEPLLTWKERIEEGGELLVQQARFAGAGKFWGRAFFPFLDAANILYSTDRRSKNFDELQEAVWLGKLDAALGILSTPRLSLKLWFFESPIRYRLNCIVLSEARGPTPEDILDMLSHARKRKRLCALIMRGEIGEAFIVRSLGLENPEWVDSLSAQKFCDALLGNAARPDGRIPIICVDEITCLLILIKLGDRGRLVFPLVPSAQYPSLAVPPSFPLGLCVSRNERVGHAKKGELMGFIRDALPVHIRGNAYNIAVFYVAQHNKIKRLVTRSLPHSTEEQREEWLTRTFALSRSALILEPPHWRAVLREAMSILGKEHVDPAVLKMQAGGNPQRYEL